MFSGLLDTNSELTLIPAAKKKAGGGAVVTKEI